MKYIILQDNNGGKWPFIFPDVCVHSDVATLAKQMLFWSHSTSSEVYSAGQWDGTTASGHSESLGVKSKPGDTAYILMGQAVSNLPPAFADSILDKWKGRNENK